jgi:choline transporter-like protein 2/4/5
MDNTESLINLNIVNTDKLISWLGDLQTTWPILAGSVGIAFIICVFYMIFIRFCAAPLAYITILLILATLAGLGYIFQARIEYYQNLNDSNYVLTMKVLCGLFYSLAGIWLLVILFMCNKIRLSIALVEASARYIASHCMLFLIPIFFFSLSVGFYIYWAFLSVYIYSTGTVEPNGSFVPNIKWDTETRYAWWFHLFALLYVNAFINALSQFVYASCAAIWYWEQGSPNAKGRIISRSFYRAFRYHLGSIAFGSLIVAIIRFMIVMVEYIKKQVDASGQKKHIGRIFNCLLSCCQCILACLARCMEFINKHAYIQVSLIYIDCYQRIIILYCCIRRIRPCIQSSW